MSNLIIQKAFEKIINLWAINEVPQIPVFYENVVDESKDFYIQSFMFPTSTDSEFLDGTHTSYDGFFQFNVVGPKNVGSQEVKSKAEEICNLFPCYSEIEESGLTVTVMNPPFVGPSIPNKNRYSVPVTVYYRCDKVEGE